MLLNFHRHEHFLKDHSIGKCVGVSVFLFFFFSSGSPFSFSVDADLTSWNGCWKPFFIIIQLKVCTCGVYLCSISFIYIFLLWIDLTSQQASHTSFCCYENGSSAFKKHRLSVYFSLTRPNLCLCFSCSRWDYLFKKKKKRAVELRMHLNSEHLHAKKRGVHKNPVSAWSFYLVSVLTWTSGRLPI